MRDTELFTIRCPWGVFDSLGNWTPNYSLSLSPGEQYRQNVENGYIKVPNVQN